MRHHDFNSLYRSTVGFDRLFQLLDGVGGVDGDAPTYPPYNIERRGENEYRITMAVAGFMRDELKVDVKESTLSVRGEKQPENKKAEYLHRGIAERGFERRELNAGESFWLRNAYGEERERRLDHLVSGGTIETYRTPNT